MFDYILNAIDLLVASQETILDVPLTVDNHRFRDIKFEGFFSLAIRKRKNAFGYEQSESAFFRTSDSYRK